MRCRGTEGNFCPSSRGRNARSVWRPLKRKGRRIARPNLKAASCMVESSPQALPKFQLLAADRTVISHSRSSFSRKHCKLRGDDAPQSQKARLAPCANVSATISAKNASNITLFSYVLGHLNSELRVLPSRDSRISHRRKVKTSANHLTQRRPVQKSLTRGTRMCRTGVH